jgi:hypothetical protein
VLRLAKTLVVLISQAEFVVNITEGEL